MAEAAADPLRPDAELVERAWADRVRAEREQVERLREVGPAEDFYAPLSSIFVADPHRTGDAVLDALLALTSPDDVWLDVGAGAGRYALPLALHVREVIAVEPSAAMTDALGASAREHGIRNVRILRDRWPMLAPPAADVALVAHLGYDVADIAAFLDALESAADRRCVAVMTERPPNSALGALWRAAHGEPRIALPALPELVSLLIARERAFEVRLAEREPRRIESRDALHSLGRHQLFVREGTEADRRLREAIDALPVEPDGSVVPPGGPRWVGIVSWLPRGSRSSG